LVAAEDGQKRSLPSSLVRKPDATDDFCIWPPAPPLCWHCGEVFE
jgi:hypothetical protein